MIDGFLLHRNDKLKNELRADEQNISFIRNRSLSCRGTKHLRRIVQ